jgi:hypothetical protein
LQQFFRFFVQALQNLVAGLNHDHIIVRRLSAHHAVHGEESGSLVGRKSAVRTGLDMEVRYAGILFIEEINLAAHCSARIRQMLRMLIPADQLHVHPPQNAVSLPSRGH